MGIALLPAPGRAGRRAAAGRWRCRAALGRVTAGVVLWAALALAGCGGGRDGAGSAEERWRRAQAVWREQRELAAGYRLWVAVAPPQPGGGQAQARLRAADAHYRRGIALIAADKPGAREELAAGKAIAPMDPALYLPLARACRDQEINIRAIDYYRWFLSYFPGAAEARAARAELHRIEPDADSEPGPRPEPGAGGSLLGWLQAPQGSLPPGSRVGLLVLLGLGGAAGLAGLLRLGWRRRRRGSLARLAADSPELQPAISYLIGRLRHELLKHRIGAVADAIQALSSGQSSAAQRMFLRERVFGGEPLLAAWDGHLRALARTLGPHAGVLRTDRGFQSADKTIRALVAQQEAFTLGQPAAIRRMQAAYARLRRFDDQLLALLMRLSRTVIDRSLLEEVLTSVGQEYAVSQVALAPIRVEPPGELVAVEVYRTDLVLVLKNLLRNAILAVGRSPEPRQVALDVELALLPTGEEIVRLRVHDTSPEPLTTEQIYQSLDPHDPRIQHGLGLVTAALHLYNGAITVEPGRPGFRKAVVVQLFRALTTPAADGEDAPAAAAGTP